MAKSSNLKLAPPPPPRSAERERLAEQIGRVTDIEAELSRVDSELVSLDLRAREARAEADRFVRGQELRAGLSQVLHGDGGDPRLRFASPQRLADEAEQRADALKRLAELGPLDRRRGDDAVDESDRLTAKLLRLEERRRGLAQSLDMARAFRLAEAVKAVILSSAEFRDLRERHAELIEELRDVHAALRRVGPGILPDIVIADDASPMAREWLANIEALKANPDQPLPAIDDGDGE